MKSHRRAQLPLTAPAPATSSHPNTLRLPGTTGGRAGCAATSGTARFALPCRPPSSAPEHGGRTPAATDLQSQGENDGQGESKLLTRAVGLDLPSKLLRVLDAILETVPPHVHLHFRVWLPAWLHETSLTCFLAFSSLACAFICWTSKESAFLLLMKRSWFPIHS